MMQNQVLQAKLMEKKNLIYTELRKEWVFQKVKVVRHMQIGTK